MYKKLTREFEIAYHETKFGMSTLFSDGFLPKPEKNLKWAKICILLSSFSANVPIRGSTCRGVKELWRFEVTRVF